MQLITIQFSRPLARRLIEALDDLGKCAAPEGETAKMKMMSFEGFMNDFGKAAPNSMNMSVYRDNFQCACGRSHWFDESIDVVCQGGLMKIMVICPVDSSFLTSLKIKTFMVFKFKGFESLSGTHLSGSEDAIAFASIRQYMRRR